MKRTKHNLSNYKLATMEMGKLYPVQLQEVLPGDSMQLSTSALIRMSPMLAPVMHPVTVRFHHWFVPNRILWDKWEDFITGGQDNQNADTPPQIDITDADWTSGSIADMFGIPKPDDGTTLSVNALPFYAYNMIWNEFYRDQDLQDERTPGIWGTPASVSWRKDYFTGARPWAQKGNDIVLPIGTSAPLRTLEDPDRTPALTRTPASSEDGYVNINGRPAGETVVADLSQATGVTATEFREFFALQRYAEARARYGSRYTEYLQYLGIKPSDARLQRPEYLGGGKSTIQFSEIMQTAYDENSPVGTLRGHGIGAVKTKHTRRFFEEHGHVITLMSVVPKSIYQDGVQRLFLKKDKEDFYQKELQSIGQQAIKQGEVYAKDPTTVNNIFGYTDRYSEYNSTPSTVSGEFRDTLDFWHMARKFDTPPALNEDFIKCNPTKRIYASQNTNPLWVMINNTCVSRRLPRKVSVGRLL